MKATGIVRNIDDLGRITVPKEIRIKLDIVPDTPLELYLTDNGGILLQPYSKTCCLCGTATENEVTGFRICPECSKKLKTALVEEA